MRQPESGEVGHLLQARESLEEMISSTIIE
jgi:hypothetical protein